MGCLWLVVMSQVKADWWGKGKGFLSRESRVLEIGRCTEWLWCHVSALLHQQYPGYPTALCNHSWAVSWVAHAVFILRGHSWPGINADLAVPDSFERTKQCWRAELLSHRWKFGAAEQVQSVLWAVGGCRETSLFHGSALPRQPSSLQEHRRRCGCKRPGHLLPLSPVQLHWARVTSLGSNNRNVLLPFLVLTDIYSTRHRGCSSALSEWSF